MCCNLETLLYHSTFRDPGGGWHHSPSHPEALRTLDVSRLMVIWPNNLDATKTIKKGRRIPKASACEWSRVALNCRTVRFFSGKGRQGRRQAPGSSKVQVFGGVSFLELEITAIYSIII